MTQSKPEKPSFAEVMHLVEQLPLDQQEQLRQKLNGEAEKQKTSVTHPFMDWRIDLDRLMAEQGVPEFNTVESLGGDFWPEDEDMDEFVATIRQWREESRVQ